MTPSETLVRNGRTVTSTKQLMRELILAPRSAELTTLLLLCRRSIYEEVVDEARNARSARFDFPRELERTGVDPSQMDLSRAELRFALRSWRLAADTEVSREILSGT